MWDKRGGAKDGLSGFTVRLGNVSNWFAGSGGEKCGVVLLGLTARNAKCIPTGTCEHN